MTNVAKIMTDVLRRHEEMVAMLSRSEEKSRRFADACAELRWPPPWHLPCTAIDRIVNAYLSKSVSPEDAIGLFASYYTPAKISALREGWEVHPWLEHRMPILREGVENHLSGRHYSSVCVLMPQVEGILRDYLKSKPTEEKCRQLVRQSRLGEAAQRFYASVLMENFAPDGPAAIPELSRHAILHGVATDYCTALHSLRMILIVDVLISSIQEKLIATRATQNS